MIKELIELFKQRYNCDPDAIYKAPGRINLIGEHTDYNGGHVFPCAIDRGTTLAIVKRQDFLLRFYSGNFDDMGVVEVNLKDLSYRTEDDWVNYPKAVIDTLIKEGYTIDQGFDFYYYGDIPNGSGLSSSASIELVTAVALDDQFSLGIDRIQLVKYCQQAENKYIGVQCGIMDQFAVGMGKEDHAILLDTNRIHFEYAPLSLGEYQLVVINTNKRRGLVDSKYNERRYECETALSILKDYQNINSLCDLSSNEFEQLSVYLEDPIIQKRTKHVVYENERTLKAKEALLKGDLKYFGQLMNESHTSLRDDYELTGIELDTIVESAIKQEGVLGSRMTGAGFGGCTISLVHRDHVDNFLENVTKDYLKTIGYLPTGYLFQVGDGAKRVY